MEYMGEFFGLTEKIKHEGIIMWEKIETGTPAEQKEYMQKMIDYNIGDIVTTEDLYFALRKYMRSPIHIGALDGRAAFTCPECGGDNLELFKTITTAAGTVQRIMVCKDDEVQFKISNRNYTKYLEHKRLEDRKKMIK